jgi:hypothetical protein
MSVFFEVKILKRIRRHVWTDHNMQTFSQLLRLPPICVPNVGGIEDAWRTPDPMWSGHRKCLQFSSMENIHIRSLMQLQPPLLPPKAGWLFTFLSLKSRNLANSHMIRPCLLKSGNLALYL